MKTIEEIKELIVQNIDDAFDYLDDTPLNDNGIYNDLSNEFIRRPENFDLETLRSRLKRLVSKHKNLFLINPDTPSSSTIPKLSISLKPVPKPKPYFSGRTMELEELTNAFQANPLIYIEGAGGIGKTQLVSKLIANLNIENRVLWYKCTPTSQPDDLIKLAGFDVLLKGENKTQRSKFSAFKDKMEQFGLLVVLDDYQEVQTNENFKLLLEFMSEYLGAAHLLVIGRDNIINPNFQIKNIRLKGMGADSILHARSLVHHSYGTKKIADSDLKIVCEQLKGYPLAIDLGIYLLSEGYSTEDIIQTAIQEANAGESFYEEISKRLLNEIFTRKDATEAEKDFLKLFSIFRGNVTEGAAKSIISDTTFKSIAKKLIRRNLLTYEDKLYSLHPLIREFCYEKLEQKEIKHQQIANYFETLRKENINIDLEDKIFYHLSCSKEWSKITATIKEKGRDFILLGYLDHLLQMIKQVTKNGINEPIFSIFEGDIAQIKGDWDLAISLFKKSMDLEKKEIRVEGKIKYGEMIHRKGNYKAAEPIYQEVFEETINNNFKKWHARVLNDMGLVKTVFGDNETALTLHQESLSIRKCLKDKSDIATSLINIGGVKSVLGDKKEALALCRKSLKINEEIGDKIGVANCLNSIGIITSALGYNEEALNLHQKSLRIVEEIGDRIGIASCLSNIGLINTVLGYNEEALILYKQSLKINEEMGDKSGIASSLNNIGSIKSDFGDKKAALNLYEQSLKINEEIGDKFGIAHNYNSIGNLKVEIGDKKAALNLYEQSLKINEEIGYKAGVSTSLNNIGAARSEIGDKKAALNLYEQSLKISEEMGDKSGIAASLNNMGAVRSDLGDEKTALSLYEQSLKISEEIGEKSGIATSLNNIAHLHSDAKKWKKASFYFLKAYGIYKQIGKVDMNDMKSNLVSLRRKHKKEFKEISQKAYQQLDNELKKVIDMNDILGLPIKAAKKIGRNDPCTCGSGKKYKKCCGKN